MHDLSVIRKNNRRHFQARIDEAHNDGKFAVVAMTGLNVMDVDIVDTAEEARNKAHLGRSRGVAYRFKILPPPPVQVELNLAPSAT